MFNGGLWLGSAVRRAERPDPLISIIHVVNKGETVQSHVQPADIPLDAITNDVLPREKLINKGFWHMRRILKCTCLT